MPDPVKISPDLLEILPKSGFFRRDLENFRQIWVFGGWFGFFGGRETETDLLESVSGGEDLPSTAGVVRLAGLGSDPVGFLGWVGSLNGFGQP